MLAISSNTSFRALVPSLVSKTAPRALVAVAAGGNVTTMLGRLKSNNHPGRGFTVSGTVSPLSGLNGYSADITLRSFTWNTGTAAIICPCNGFIRTITVDTFTQQPEHHQVDAERSPAQSHYNATSHTLKGEDVENPDESEPMDDRDWDSHHNHHKDESIPLDDRDFDSRHSMHNNHEIEAEPMDDRDFDSRHRPGSVQQPM